jgi:hypothetical protein
MLIGAVLAALVCSQALGDEIALRSAQVWSTEPVPFSGTLGWRFSVRPPQIIYVTKLGVIDADGDGLSAPHRVGLWRLDGTLLASATVPAGTEAVLENGYRYVPIDPVTLYPSAGPGPYLVGAHYVQGDPEAVWSHLTRLPVLGPELGLAEIIGIGRIQPGADLAFPTQYIPAPEGQEGPVPLQANFQYVPEPAGAVAAASGACWLLLRPKKRRTGRVRPQVPVSAAWTDRS